MTYTIWKYKYTAADVYDLYQRTGVPIYMVMEILMEQAREKGGIAVFYMGLSTGTKKVYRDLSKYDLGSLLDNSDPGYIVFKRGDEIVDFISFDGLKEAKKAHSDLSRKQNTKLGIRALYGQTAT